MFRPYSGSASVVGVEDGMVVLELEGSLSYSDGEYMNERNATIEVCLSAETAGEIAQVYKEKVD